MNLSPIPASTEQTCFVLLVLGWNPAVKNIPGEVHYRPSEHVYEKTQYCHACFSARWPSSVAKAFVWCSSAQYLFWCSWCHRLKSMLNATMLPETMPVIKVLLRKRNKDSTFPKIIPQLPQEDSVEETDAWMICWNVCCGKWNTGGHQSYNSKISNSPLCRNRPLKSPFPSRI